MPKEQTNQDIITKTKLSRYYTPVSPQTFVDSKSDTGDPHVYRI